MFQKVRKAFSPLHVYRIVLLTDTFKEIMWMVLESSIHENRFDIIAIGYVPTSRTYFWKKGEGLLIWIRLALFK